MNSSILKRPPAWIQPKAPQKLKELFYTKGVSKTAKKGTFIAYEGDEPEYMYYIVSGTCRHTFSLLGNAFSTISLVLPGRVIGDIFAILKNPILFKYEVLQTVEMLVLPSHILHEKLKLDNNLTMEMMKYFCQKQHSHMEGMASNAVLSAKERIETLFFHLAHEATKSEINGYLSMPVRLTQDVVGEITNTSRVTVNRLLSEWITEKYIIKKDGHYFISKNFLTNLEKC